MSEWRSRLGRGLYGSPELSPGQILHARALAERNPFVPLVDPRPRYAGPLEALFLVVDCVPPPVVTECVV